MPGTGASLVLRDFQFGTMSRAVNLSSLVFAIFVLAAANSHAEYTYGDALKPACQARPGALIKTMPVAAKPVMAMQYAVVAKPALGSEDSTNISTYFNLAQALFDSREFQFIHSGYVPRQPNPSTADNRIPVPKNISSVIRLPK